MNWLEMGSDLRISIPQPCVLLRAQPLSLGAIITQLASAFAPSSPLVSLVITASFPKTKLQLAERSRKTGFQPLGLARPITHRHSKRVKSGHLTTGRQAGVLNIFTVSSVETPASGSLTFFETLRQSIPMSETRDGTCLRPRLMKP